MTVRTYGQLSYTVAVLGAAEVMRGQPDPFTFGCGQEAALERLSGVPQLCERRSEAGRGCKTLSLSVAVDPFMLPEVGSRIFSETPRAQ